MTRVAGAAGVLVFGTAAIEGLIRGGSLAAVAAAAIAGALAAIGAGLLAVLARGVARLLPAAQRAWAPGVVLAGLGFVVAEFVAARALAVRFRDPALVAAVAAAAGVAIAWVCLAVVLPAVVRVAAIVGRALDGRAGSATSGSRALAVAGWVVVAGGAAAWLAEVPEPRRRPPGAIAAGVIDMAQAITDVDGDGDGLLVRPLDCAPLSPQIDGTRCAADP